MAVGTTAARVLETLARHGARRHADSTRRRFGGLTAIYITPGYEFRGVDALADQLPPAQEHRACALTMAFAGVRTTAPGLC